MHPGLLTAPFGPGTPVQELAPWAAGLGYRALEIDCGDAGQLVPGRTSPTEARAAAEACRAAGVRISGLAWYAWQDLAGDRARVVQGLHDRLALAEAVGAECLCTFAGCPAPGQDRMEAIRALPDVFGAVVEDAARRGVRIAFENWYATNTRGLDHLLAIAEALPQAHVGFNLDPSHLAWQGIDYLHAVERLRGRIHHTHAKDVRIDAARRAVVGTGGDGWWRYVLPGHGEVRWGEWVHQLRCCGYDGVLSLEHEDRAYGAKQGAERGARFLATLL